MYLFAISSQNQRWSVHEYTCVWGLNFSLFSHKRNDDVRTRSDSSPSDAYPRNAYRIVLFMLMLTLDRSLLL